MNRVVLLIGGNQGDRFRLIEQATEQIRQRIGSVVALSRIYETAPWGRFDSPTPNFLNRALLVATSLAPLEVLREALAIEASLGRIRPSTPFPLRGTPPVSGGELLSQSGCSPETGELSEGLRGGLKEQPQRTYHSRPMDIDIIFYDDLVVDTPELTLPHPRMHLRRFVLEPLVEIMPDYVHPLLHKTMKQLLDEI